MFRYSTVRMFLYIIISILTCFVVGQMPGPGIALSVFADEESITVEDQINDDILLEKFMFSEEWVTVASKRKQKKRDVPSAVFVITADDIEQMGVNRLADVFRMAPGMDVVTVDGNSSLVSIRGFAIDTLGVNSISNLAEFSKRLLVLVDGRAIYNPAFGGVFWDQEPVFLEDIERIEIIRGPGAALYGANAVNGVISIITKDPETTHGAMAKVTYGSQETAIGNIRYGGSIGKFHYRITGGYREDDGFDDGFQADTIGDFNDFKRDQKVNFRGKYKFSEDMNVEIFAGFMDGAQGEQFGGQVFFGRGDFNTDTTRDLTRAFLQLGFNKTFSDTSDLHFQIFADYTDMDESDTTFFDAEGKPRFVLDPFEIDVRKYDVSLQHSFAIGSKNIVTLGVNYRNNQLWSRLTGSNDGFNMQIATGKTSQKFKQEHNDIFGLFLQDDFKIFDNLSLTAGVKMEHNSFTGTDLSPRVSFVYSPWEQHTFRVSYSRAYRTPTFFEDSGFFNVGFTINAAGRKNIPLTIVGGVGNNDLMPERLDSYEFGYRGVFFDKLEFNVETYFTRYKHLITTAFGFRLDNTSRADTNGFEISLRYPFSSWFEIFTNYSFINFNARISDNIFKRIEGTPDDTTPKQKANLGLRFKSKTGFSANIDLHYVDRIKVALGNNNDRINQVVDDYIRVDVRLAKKFWNGRGELAITGQNLQEGKHAEFADVEVERAGFISLEINF
ncbi:MAG: TonB-dependent receptor plug domain-containing protein [Candidatus Anammoxibacter sp.]